MPALLNWGLTQSLQQYGLTNITLKISEVGLSQASVKQLDVTYPDGDTTLRIQLNQVSLDYTLPQLITGQAETLLVDSVVLTLDQQTSQQASSSPTLPTIEQLLAAYNSVDASGFPLGALKLPNIKIVHNLSSESETKFDTIELQTELTKRPNQLNAKLLFANQQQLNWNIDQDAGWRVELLDASAQHSQNAGPRHAIFQGSLNRVDQSLVFSAEVTPSSASTQQNESSIEFSGISLNGTIKSNKSQPGLAILSIIEIQGVDYQDWNIQTINGQFDTQIAQASATFDQSQTSWQVNVKSDSTVSIMGASSADWRADHVTLNVGSDVSLTQNLTTISLPEVLLNVGELQQADDLLLSDTSFTGAASLRIDAEQWQLDVAESWQLTNEYSRLDDTELPQGWALTSAMPLHLEGTLQAASTDILLKQTLLDVSIPIVQDKTLDQGVKLHNTSLRIEQARFNQGELYVTGLLAVPHLTLNNATNSKPETNWRLDNLKQSFEINDQLLISRGSAQSAERELHIETVSKHDFKQRQGSSEFHFKPLKFSDPARFNQIISPVASPVELVAGEVDLSGQARWRGTPDQWQVNVDIDAQLKNLGGAYEEAYFSGANGKLSLQVYPELSSKSTLWLSVAHVDAGVANSDVALEFKLRPSKFGDLPMIDILHAQTQLLQGSVKLKPTAYDLNQPKQTLQVVLENIDLNELVTLQQLDDVQATGLVSGVLPIIIENGQISIDDGQLQAIAPGGVLRYQADADALQANQYAETVVLALRDFHYDVLRADTQYKPDGTLLLELQLKGNNPDFEQGRQINLNINLEQNVLKLLESLRLYDGVNDRLDKRVQDFYQETRS